MKWATAGLGMIVFVMFVFMGVYYVIDGTIVNEEDYHALKESMVGAMYDSIDMDYYYNTGEIKIIKEKFVENFTRRFNDTTLYGKQGYKLEFYDIIESPPKASVIITGSSDEFKLDIDSNDLSSYDIVNRLDAILNYDGKHFYTYELYSLSAAPIFNQHTGPVGIWTSNIKIPEELKTTFNTCKIINIEYAGAIEKVDYASIKETFLENARSKWYGSPQMIGDANWQKIINSNEDTFCEIETLECFSYTSKEEEAGAASACPKEINSCGVDCLHDLQVTYKEANCENNLKDMSLNYVTGYKFKVTWECSQ